METEYLQRLAGARARMSTVERVVLAAGTASSFATLAFVAGLLVIIR